MGVIRFVSNAAFVLGSSGPSRRADDNDGDDDDDDRAHTIVYPPPSPPPSPSPGTQATRPIVYVAAHGQLHMCNQIGNRMR